MNEVCFIVGFNNPSYFARCFQKQFGILPKDYVKKGNIIREVHILKHSHFDEKKLSLQ
ncbi:AraC family transcriptional regulator [Bacteroides ovatus]|nr:AraC family transcriptional regulator [Bacteroides ovatus]